MIVQVHDTDKNRTQPLRGVNHLSLPLRPPKLRSLCTHVSMQTRIAISDRNTFQLGLFREAMDPLLRQAAGDW